jgi:hypothetical protein
MKRSLSLIVIIAAFALAACNGNSTGPRSVRAGRGSGAGGAAVSSGGIPGALGTTTGPNITTPSSTGSLGWGIITPSSDQATDSFLSTNFSTGQVGSTTGNCVTGPGFGSVPCVVKFTVTTQATPVFNPVTLQTGSLSTALNMSTPDYFNDGFITISFWDSLSGTSPTSDFPQGLPPIPVVVPLSTQTGNYNSYVSTYGASFAARAGAVSGYQSPINLIFADDEGAIGVVGTITGTQFTGTIQYSNSPQFGGASGNLGQFTINACDIMAPCP